MLNKIRLVLSVLLTFALISGCGEKETPEKKEETTPTVQLQKSSYPTAPDFTLKDLNGNKISLRELRGKVVVIDFWATWCGPCLRSFPAMQKAADKYKSDPDVVFLFINTWERSGNVQSKVSEFIHKKGYDIQVLLDLDNSVVESFGVDGIPAKFIVDKMGGIRHKSKGMFPGSNAAAVADLSKHIEEAKL